jgi:hypothetical protein
MGGTCDRYGRKNKWTNTFVGNLKIIAYLFGTPDHRLEDDIKVQYEVWRGDVIWIDVAEKRLLRAWQWTFGFHKIGKFLEKLRNY